MVYNFVLVCPNYKQGIACTVDDLLNEFWAYSKYKKQLLYTITIANKWLWNKKSAFCALS